MIDIQKLLESTTISINYTALESLVKEFQFYKEGYEKEINKNHDIYLKVGKLEKRIAELEQEKIQAYQVNKYT